MPCLRVITQENFGVWVLDLSSINKHPKMTASIALETMRFYLLSFFYCQPVSIFGERGL